MKLHQISYIIFGVLMVGYIVIDRSNFSLFTMQTFVSNAAPLLLAGLAELVVLLAGGIDLSVGSILSLVTVVVASGHFGHGLVSVASGLLIGLLAGLFNGVLTGLLKLPDLIVTLATSSVFGGLALTVMNTPGGTAPQLLQTLASFELGIVPWALIVLGLVSVAVFVVLSRTRLGKHMIATGSNRQSATVSGVNTQRSKLYSYAIAGLLAGISGLMLCGLTTSGDPNIGSPYTLEAIAAAVLGGCSLFGGDGTVTGVLSGALILTVISNILFVLNASANLEYIVSGGILVVAIAFSNLWVGGRKSRRVSRRKEEVA